MKSRGAKEGHEFMAVWLLLLKSQVGIAVCLVKLWFVIECCFSCLRITNVLEL